MNSIEVIRNEDPLWAEGTICDGTRGVIHYRQSPHPGEVYYFLDLASYCECGRRFKDHEMYGIAVGVIE